jgi:hypothetical protein
MMKAFSIKTAIGLSAILGLTLALPVWAKGKNGGGGGSSTGCTTTNVNSTLFDQDSQSPPQLFQIQSDGHGAYQTFSAHRPNDSVTSEITSNCYWVLDTTKSTTRGIKLTLAYPESTNPPAPPFNGTQEVQGELITFCSSNPANNGVDFGNMKAVGDHATCPMHLLFYDSNGTLYTLAMNPYPAYDGYATMMQVICTGASGGLCSQWTVAPDPTTSVVNPSTGQASAIGELLQPPCPGCAGGTDLGEYFVSFSFLIQK